MTKRARQDIRSSFAGTARRLVLRSLAASTFFLAAAIALSATSPSWAGRIWSDAAAVKASVSKGLFHAAYRPDATRDTAPDDYVQGLVRLGIIAPRS
jgi:hypothetical protein